MSAKLRKQKSQKAEHKRRSLLSDEGLRVAKKGKRLYLTKLKALLEPAHWGMFVAVEADSGDYFLGEEMGEAITKARAKHPDKLVYIARVGFRAAASARTRRQQKTLGCDCAAYTGRIHTGCGGKL